MFENWPNENMIIQDPLLNYFIFALLVIYPLYRVTRRAGLPFWTACTIFVPYIGMVIVAALFAHMKWNVKIPASKKTTPKKKAMKTKAGKK